MVATVSPKEVSMFDEVMGKKFTVPADLYMSMHPGPFYKPYEDPKVVHARVKEALQRKKESEEEARRLQEEIEVQKNMGPRGKIHAFFGELRLRRLESEQTTLPPDHSEMTVYFQVESEMREQESRESEAKKMDSVLS